MVPQFFRAVAIQAEAAATLKDQRRQARQR
jgi:hypothetical protein